MKRVLIATITEADVCSASFCVSLAQTTKMGLTKQVDLYPVAFSANGNWSMAFNHALTLAWKEKLDGFVCVNPRVSWEPAALLGLVSSDKDAVAMPVATKNGFEVRLGETPRLQEDSNTGEVKAQSASLDFFYLSSRSVNLLCTTHPKVNYQGEEIQLVLQSGDIYDSYFDPREILAYRLKEHGIEVWVNVKHTARRQDTLDYSSNFEEVLSRLKEDG